MVCMAIRPHPASNKVIIPYAQKRKRLEEAFTFQAMAEYNAAQSAGKTALAGLNSASAESLYHYRVRKYRKKKSTPYKRMLCTLKIF